MPAATPANSAQSVPVLAITRAREDEGRRAAAVALADQGQQALAGDDPQPHAELVEDDQRRGREGQHPEQLVAVLGAEDRVGGDPGRVVVGEAGEQAGADDRQQRRHRAAAQQQRGGGGRCASAGGDRVCGGRGAPAWSAHSLVLEAADLLGLSPG